MHRALVVPLLVVACACAAEREYSHSSGLTFSIPAEWREERLEHGVSLSRARSPATLNVHSMPRASEEVTRIPEAVARALVVQYRTLGDSRVRSRSGARLAGARAWVVEVRFRHDGRMYRREQYVAEHAGRIVHLDATAPERTWDDVEPVLARALDTARWR